MRLEFVDTGNMDLDHKVLGGKGFPRPGTVYILGHPGVGKTQFTLSYLVHRAKKGEKGLYITFIESKEFLLSRCRSFNFYQDLIRFVEEGIIRIETLKPIYGFNIQSIYDLLQNITALINQGEYKNLVIDSVTSLSAYLEPKDVRTLVTQISDLTYRKGLTTILIGELPLYGESLSVSFEAFIVDVMIVIDYIWVLGATPRLTTRLFAVKSRISPIDRTAYEVIVDEDGLRILGEIIEKHIPFKSG